MAPDTAERNVLAAWGIRDLKSILGADRSPPSFSDHLRKHLASLAKIATLEEARQLLLVEVNSRLLDRNRSRGVPRPFLTDIDVKRVLSELQPSQQHHSQGSSATPEPTTPSNVVKTSSVPHSSTRRRAATVEPTSSTTPSNHREAPSNPSTYPGVPPSRQKFFPASSPPGRAITTPTASKTHTTSVLPSTFATPSGRGSRGVSIENMSTPPDLQLRGSSSGTDVALKFKRKSEMMRAEMDDDLEDLSLKLEEAEMAVKMTKRRLHKANESYNNTKAQRDAITTKEAMDAKIECFSTLETDLASLRESHRQTLDEDVGTDDDDRETTDEQPMPIAHHIDQALAQIAHAIKTLKEKKTSRQELAAAAEKEVRRAESHLKAVEEESKRAKERVHKCQVEYDEAQQVRKTLGD